MGLVACAATMYIAGQYETHIPTYYYAMIYLVVSLASQALGLGGGGGPKPGADAPTLSPGDLRYVQTKGAEAAPGTLNKVVVIEQWATWCGPCVHMVPHLNSIYNAHKDNPAFQLVGVTSESDPKLIQDFILKHSMEYSVALDTKGVVGTGYPCSGIPNATIVGKDGKVFWNGHPGSMDAKLKEALAAPDVSNGASTKPSGGSTSKSSAAAAKDVKKTE